ncbi:peroxisome proliferator-activated receptor gamma coactivator 1-beta [Paramormyrops kingsleyae]|uniref:peroxisome proliferator-activated receptor gamma coactivator 1-beta n=1 Tax=Paramormyrops kingsleyae TaxID=1676925 RepID=UPI003B96DBD0
MADGASLLDEELSSFVFNYLTESSGSQNGEGEVSSDRLDVDFSDIDLSQLDASDFDSVSCLNELHWYNDQSDGSPTSTQYSTGDPEFFEIEEENAALLAALTDSLDEVGGLGVFPSLGEGLEEEEEEEEEDLPQDNEPFPGSLSPETEDPSLLKKLLLSPPIVPVGSEALKGGALYHGNKSQHLKPLRQLAKGDSVWERKPRPPRPAGRPCSELHRHLITLQQVGDAASVDTEEDSESDLERDDQDESSSGSEAESCASSEAAESQFSSEQELRGVVELITYMHTYCLPSRKHGAGVRPECPQSRPSAACPRPPPLAAPGSRPRVPLARPREFRRHSLLRELLEAVKTFDVSKPYRLQSPPYSHGRPMAPDRKSEGVPQSELKDSGAPEATAGQRSSSGDTSFSVRRSRRLASFPSRFARKSQVGPGRPRAESVTGRCCEEAGPAKLRCTKLPAKETQCGGGSCKAVAPRTAQLDSPYSQNEKRSQLCLPLAPKSTGVPQYPSKPFEQNLSVELCGTAGLTPPTTPPHKSVEDEPFRPEGRAEGPPRGSWLSRAHPRKLLEQTELYAQLRGISQPDAEGRAQGPVHRTFGDHDYCLQGLAGKEGGARGRPYGGQLRPEDLLTSNALDSHSGEGELPHSPQNTEGSSTCPSPDHCCPPDSPGQLSFSREDSETGPGDEQSSQAFDDCQVFYIHNLPCGVTRAMLCERFEALGEPRDCKIIVKDRERCGVVTFRQPPGGSVQRHRWELPPRNGSPRKFSRKRYIDLDEAGPGPVKSKYDALDFDTLLKEAQRSLHR